MGANGLSRGFYDCPGKVSIHKDVICMSKPNQTLVCNLPVACGATNVIRALCLV